MIDVSPKTALVAGHICLDVFPDMGHLQPGSFEQQFRPGHLITVGGLHFSTGGPVSNVGLALHHLGIPARLVTRIGDDPFGLILQDIIKSRGPHLLDDMITSPQGETSYSLIISPPGVDRIFLHCPGLNDDFSAEDIDDQLLEQADLLHFGYPPIMRKMYENDGVGLVDIFQRAKAAGLTTSLDMCFPDPASPGGRADRRTILQAVLRYVDIFLPSFEEMLFMLHRDIYESAGQGRGVLGSITPAQLSRMGDELLQLGVKVAVLKLGHHGLYMKTAGLPHLGNMGRAAPPNLSTWADQEVWSPCYQVKVVGTTGSGDATIAGFLSGLLRGMPPEQVVNAAVAVGACNVEAADALGGLLTWEETLSRINRGWPKHPLTVEAPGWEWEEQHELWRRMG